MTNALSQYALYLAPTSGSQRWFEFTNTTNSEWTVSFGSDSGRTVMPLPNRSRGNLLVASNFSNNATMGLSLYFNDQSLTSGGAQTHQVSGGYIGYSATNTLTGLPGSGIGSIDLRDFGVIPRPIGMGQGLEGQTLEAAIWKETSGVPQSRAPVCKLEDSHGGAGNQYHMDISSIWERQIGRHDLSVVPSWWYGLPDAFLINHVYPSFCAQYFAAATGPWTNKVVVVEESRHDFTSTNETGSQAGTLLTISATLCDYCLAPGYVLTTPSGTETLVTQVSSALSNGQFGDLGVYTTSSAQNFTGTVGTYNIQSVGTVAGVEQLFTAFAQSLHAQGIKLEWETDPITSGYAPGELQVNAWMRADNYAVGDGMWGDYESSPVFAQTSNWGSSGLGPPLCFTPDNIHLYEACQTMESSMAHWQTYNPQFSAATGAAATSLTIP
jgi:hypothetical protein